MVDDTPMTPHHGLDEVRTRIAAAEVRSGRRAGSVTLVAVSKGHGIDAIAAAYRAGQRDFGENRADELAHKAPHLPDDIRWHFVGSLQSRKARIVAPHTWLLHSMDRRSLVKAWAPQPDTDPEPGDADASDPGVGRVPPVLIQVNVAAEPQKQGVLSGDLPGLLETVVTAGIECRGLMAIPPAPDTPEESRPWFEALVRMRDLHVGVYPTLTELSMGMSDDLEVAIETGSTVVRVGRAIFGERDRTVNRWDPVGERGN